MSANIDSNLANWSTTDESNQPDGTDSADIDAEFRRLQAVLRKYLRTKGSDIASASTVDLSAATGDYLNITGTATITSFGTVAAGMRFILQFNAAAVITHNATSLILPGGVNITAVAGDVAWLESLGSGNWKCLMYQNDQNAGSGLRAGTYANVTGTGTTITGIPAGVNRVTLMIAELVKSGGSDYIVQIGGSGGLETSGYVAAACFDGSSTTATQGFTFKCSIGGGNTFYGSLVLTRLTGNTWVCNGMVGDLTYNYGPASTGAKTLSSELTQIKLTTVYGSGDTFASGVINILYE